ncbi:MAG: transcriptional regulator [Spirochaetes bacterium]|nr:MAG: transcriptional regulator [Spirochaetota bacterium]
MSSIKQKDVIDDLKQYKRKVKMLDSIIESSFDGIWISDRDGKVLRINKASERINEVKISEVVGRNVRDLLKEGLYNKSVTLEVLERKTPVTLLQKVRSGKSILVTGSPIFDDEGNLEMVVVNERDITHLNMLNQALKESQALTKKYQSELSRIQLGNLEKGNIIYKSETMDKVIKIALKACDLDCCVLLLGQSGVGKNLIAKLIHRYSSRSSGPFICVSCGAIPESLIESELFGYEKGAFTGARREGKPGVLELTDQGTLFLDEIDQLPIHLQVKLLHFLEEKEILRVGGIKYIKIDARIIAASNQNLAALVKEKKFREDLFFRLNVIPIYIHPLRERPEDIPPLVNFFLGRYNEKYKKDIYISPEAVDILCEYEFPGNVRELSNIIERIATLSENRKITPEDLPQYIRKSVNTTISSLDKEELPLRKAVDRLESFMIRKALKKYKSQIKAARALGVTQPTINRKIKKYGINHHIIVH